MDGWMDGQNARGRDEWSELTWTNESIYDWMDGWLDALT
jgi:hypothetical protein